MSTESQLKFEILKNNLNELNKQKILNLIKKENNQSILSKLSNKIIDDYLKIVQSSSFLKLFCLKHDDEIIAYAITSTKPKYLLSEFKQLKIKIFFSLIKNFKILTLFNLLFSILNLDMIFLKNENIKKINENLNLNLIAVERKHQSKGIGSLFLKKIISHYKEREKPNFMTCETFDQKAVNFYINRCGFKIIGKKLRIPRNLNILEYKF